MVRFGHQDDIQGMDSLSKERFVTCGGRDRSVRIWKVAEESQLVFNGHKYVFEIHTKVPSINTSAYKKFSERLGALRFEMRLCMEQLVKFAVLPTTNFIFRKNCTDIKQNHYNTYFKAPV